MPSSPIQDLLQQKDTLHEIASVLYGDQYLLQKDFWGSPTEKELFQVYQQLDLLGYDQPVSDEHRAIGEMIFEKLVNDGIFPPDEDEEEDDDDF